MSGVVGARLHDVPHKLSRVEERVPPLRVAGAPVARLARTGRALPGQVVIASHRVNPHAHGMDRAVSTMARQNGHLNAVPGTPLTFPDVPLKTS
jgi:hypothetical protein